MCDLVSVCFERRQKQSLYAQLTGIADAKRNIRNDYKLLIYSMWQKWTKRGWKGQIKVWMEAIFLPYKAMKMQYPYLEKYPVFLPAAWIQRNFSDLLLQKRKSREKFFSGMKVEGNEVRKRQISLEN